MESKWLLLACASRNPPPPVREARHELQPKPGPTIARRGSLLHRSPRLPEGRYLKAVIVTVIDSFGPQKNSREIGWVRTNAHPVNNRPLNQLSFDLKYRPGHTRCLAGSGRGAAPSLSVQ